MVTSTLKELMDQQAAKPIAITLVRDHQP